MFAAITIIAIVAAFTGLARALKRALTTFPGKSSPAVRSFIPWLGSFVEFAWNAQNFLRKYQNKYGPVFRVRIAGRTFVVIADAEGIADVMRDPHKALTNNFNTAILEAAGDIAPTQFRQSLFDKLAFAALHSFSNRSIPRFSSHLHRNLRLNLETFLSSNGDTRVSLTDFVGGSLYDAVCKALWGPHFPTDSFSDFQLIDTNVSRLLSPFLLPPRQAVRARRSLKSRLGAFLDKEKLDYESPDGETFGGMDLIDAIRESNLPASDQQGVLLSIMFALHSNSIRMSTWFMAYLLCDSNAWCRLRQEIDDAISDRFGSLELLLSSPPHLLGREFLPLLNSALKEALRLSVAAVLMRRVMKDCRIIVNANHSVDVTEGEYIFTNGCAINLEDEHFEGANTFRVDRFVDGNTMKEQPITAFGGGFHMCKGRDLALYEMKILAILCLSHFDIRVEHPDGSSAEGCSPRADYTYPTPVFYPKELFVRVQKRRGFESL